MPQEMTLCLRLIWDWQGCLFYYMWLCACSAFETVDGIEFLSCPAVVANTSFLLDSASVVMDPYYYGYQVICIKQARTW